MCDLCYFRLLCWCEICFPLVKRWRRRWWWIPVNVRPDWPSRSRRRRPFSSWQPSISSLLFQMEYVPLFTVWHCVCVCFHKTNVTSVSSPHIHLSLVSVHVFVNEFPWLTVTSWRVWQNRASWERVGQCLDLDSMVSSVFFLLYVDLRYTKFKKITAAAFQCLTSGLLSLCREQNCFLS